MIQQTTQKTKTPAKMVANGGPDASLLLSDPPEELLFDADIGSSLCLSCTRTALLNLKLKWARKAPWLGLRKVTKED